MATRLNRAKKGIKQTREAEECYEDSAKVKIGDEVIMRDVNIAKEAHHQSGQGRRK
ncbi:MAG: hypothetical protein IJZ76_11680 [Lachnospiraceae bacterium]|nr:hypothetical protein [Lachnospiraceae bacterium]